MDNNQMQMPEAHNAEPMVDKSAEIKQRAAKEMEMLEAKDRHRGGTQGIRYTA